MNLCGWLRLVGDTGIAARERNEAATRIRANVMSWARPYLGRAAPCKLGDDDVDETVQHLLTRCALGTSRFNGSSEGEAHSWCMRVVLNKGRDICRERRRNVSTTREDDEGEPRSFEPAVEADLRPLAIESLQEIFAAIQDELPRLHRKQDIEGLVRSVRCHVEARMGASLEEQVTEYGGDVPEGEGEKALVRARNRVYQYRKRGREAACEALSSLVAQGRYAPEDVDDARRLIGCDVQVSRPEKVLS
jgi:DNA-directed RNA polymerase specialized sigma24 family protein